MTENMEERLINPVAFNGEDASLGTYYSLCLTSTIFYLYLLYLLFLLHVYTCVSSCFDKI